MRSRGVALIFVRNLTCRFPFAVRNLSRRTHSCAHSTGGSAHTECTAMTMLIALCERGSDAHMQRRRKMTLTHTTVSAAVDHADSDADAAQPVSQPAAPPPLHFTMPSVYSRLSSYMTPQWLLLLVSSYVAMRFVSRLMAARRAAAAVARVQQAKRLRRDADMAVLDDRIADTLAERANGTQEEVVQQSATALVAKMAAGQTDPPLAWPRTAVHSSAGSCTCNRVAQRSLFPCVRGCADFVIVALRHVLGSTGASLSVGSSGGGAGAVQRAVREQLRTGTRRCGEGRSTVRITQTHTQHTRTARIRGRHALQWAITWRIRRRPAQSAHNHAHSRICSTFCLFLVLRRLVVLWVVCTVSP